MSHGVFKEKQIRFKATDESRKQSSAPYKRKPKHKVSYLMY